MELVLIASLELDTGWVLNGESPTVESALEAVNTDVAACVFVPNNVEDCEVATPNVDLVGVDDTCDPKIPDPGLLDRGLLENKLEVTAVSLLLIGELFVLLPFVKFAKKSNEDGCDLLNPPNPLNTPFLLCKENLKH